MFVLIIIIISLGLFIWNMISDDNVSLKSTSAELLYSKYYILINTIKAGSEPKTFTSTNNEFTMGWITDYANNKLYFNQRSGYLEIRWHFDFKLGNTPRVVFKNSWIVNNEDDQKVKCKEILDYMTKKLNEDFQ